MKQQWQGSAVSTPSTRPPARCRQGGGGAPRTGSSAQPAGVSLLALQPAGGPGHLRRLKDFSLAAPSEVYCCSNPPPPPGASQVFLGVDVGGAGRVGAVPQVLLVRQQGVVPSAAGPGGDKK